MNRDTLALIIGGLFYSVVSLAYIHTNFSSKDTMSMIVDRLDRIEKKLDRVIGRNTEGLDN